MLNFIVISGFIDCVFNNSHNRVASVNKFFMPTKENSVYEGNFVQNGPRGKTGNGPKKGALQKGALGLSGNLEITAAGGRSWVTEPRLQILPGKVALLKCL